MLHVPTPYIYAASSCDAYGVHVTQVKAALIGDTVSCDAIVAALKANTSIKMVCLTQVDTSTGEGDM